MFGAVYKIKCSDCQATNIGGTSGNLSTRLKEHKRGTNKGDLNNNIAKYHLKTNHTIDCDSATCLNYSTDYYQRIALESWFITLEQTDLIFVNHFPHLTNVYSTGNSNKLFVIPFTTHLFAQPPHTSSQPITSRILHLMMLYS